jgi:hypothetical protein
MIELRRAQQRFDERRGKQAVWLTFHTQTADDDALANGFGRLELFSEVVCLRAIRSERIRRRSPKPSPTCSMVRWPIATRWGARGYCRRVSSGA